MQEETIFYRLQKEMEQQLEELRICVEDSGFWWYGAAGEGQRMWMEQLLAERNEENNRYL